jgi:hypothetical protein
MINAGVSLYHPDPLAALEQAERAKVWGWGAMSSGTP